VRRPATINKTSSGGCRSDPSVGKFEYQRGNGRSRRDVCAPAYCQEAAARLMFRTDTVIAYDCHPFARSHS
jgi:hypothetical protein